jgi:hypothetical protein
MRLERPAARSTTSTFNADLAGCGAGSRGCGLVGISIKSPPTPMPAMSPAVTSSPAISRSSTQSKPFSFGLRAHPGAPTTRLPSSIPSTSRLPGSTGMPARMTVPPARSIAAGTTSAKSLIADAPKITTMSLSRASCVAAAATGATSCGVRRSAVSRPPERARRASVTRKVLSSTLDLTPGSTVWMTPTLMGR